LSFFDELKRRNVVRVGIAYLIGGWLVVQVADIVLENIESPDWVMQAILLVVVLGFVVALFFSWAFEATPEGIKRESEVDRSQSITRVTGHKLNRSIVVMLIIALAYFVWESRIASRAPVSATAEASVAVLAFENMSPDPENAFFAEGVSEEILNVLAAVDGLRVASRTSAFSFADSDIPITEIASQLGVAHVLEGSVRRQGVRVRITAQLIDATNDTHLWSDTYDRDLDDIFAVQEEIAVAISDALMGALGMKQISVSAPTSDFEAYESFLRGRQQFYARGVGPLMRSIADLEAAVARDPEFAEAWSFLAASLRTVPGYTEMSAAGASDFQRRAAAAAERALALDPTQALAVAVQGQVASTSDRILAVELLDRAVEMAPDDAGILMWAGDERFISGAYLDEAIPLLERSNRLDPLSGINNGVLGVLYLASGRRELAYQHIRQANEIGWPHGTTSMVLDMLWRGDVDAAVEANRAYWPANEEDWTDDQKLAWDVGYRVLRGEITSDELAEIVAVTNNFNEDPGWQVTHFLYVGDLDRMFDAWMAKSHDPDFLFRNVYIPSGRAVMEHPRMIEIVERSLLFPLWESKGYPFDCERVQDDVGDHLSCPNWPE
jgi:TolB-like protein